MNGSTGIAVGMATNIPPHNLGEVIDATIHLIDHPEATPDDLMQFVKGPDFPTGGLILGRAGIMEAYRTGRGSVKMRAKAEIEEAGKRGDRFQIVVTEMPYQVSHDAVATRIKELADSAELGVVKKGQPYLGPVVIGRLLGPVSVDLCDNGGDGIRNRGGHLAPSWLV